MSSNNVHTHVRVIKTSFSSIMDTSTWTTRNEQTQIFKEREREKTNERESEESPDLTNVDGHFCIPTKIRGQPASQPTGISWSGSFSLAAVIVGPGPVARCVDVDGHAHTHTWSNLTDNHPRAGHVGAACALYRKCCGCGNGVLKLRE